MGACVAAPWLHFHSLSPLFNLQIHERAKLFEIADGIAFCRNFTFSANIAKPNKSKWILIQIIFSAQLLHALIGLVFRYPLHC